MPVLILHPTTTFPLFIDHKDAAAQSAFLLFENCRSIKVHLATAIAAVHQGYFFGPRSGGVSPNLCYIEFLS